MRTDAGSSRSEHKHHSNAQNQHCDLSQRMYFHLFAPCSPSALTSGSLLRNKKTYRCRRGTFQPKSCFQQACENNATGGRTGERSTGPPPTGSTSPWAKCAISFENQRACRHATFSAIASVIAATFVAAPAITAARNDPAKLDEL